MNKRWYNMTVSISAELKDALEPYRASGAIRVASVVQQALAAAVEEAKADEEHKRKALALYDDAAKQGVLPEKYKV